LPLLTALRIVVRLAPVDAALATALCVAVPSPSAQPVALAPVLPLLTALRIVVRLAPVDAALVVLGSGS